MPPRTSKPPARAAPPAAAARVPFRVTGLDGLRALAVTAVLLYHLSPGGVVGGYIGVDVFFVVSGFLITSLLLRERAATGRIRVWAFWRRRARRLVPALIVLLLVCSTLAFAIGGDVLVGIGAQVLGAADLQHQLAAHRVGRELLRGVVARAVPQPLVARRGGAVLPDLADRHDRGGRAGVAARRRVTFLAVLTVGLRGGDGACS